MKRFLIALQFLTILPVKISSKLENKDFGGSLVYFPLIGAVIGLVLTLVFLAFNFLPTLVMAALVLIASIVITGGVHLDGLADTCDGFYGFTSKERTLEIMRDSRTGVMGTIAVVSLLLFKFTLLASINKNIFPQALIMMAVFGRYAQVLACYASHYVREQGKAKYFIEYASGKGFFIALIFTAVISLLLMGLKGIVIFALSLIPVYLFIHYIKKRIGGMTGDTVGATSEIAESIILFLILIWQAKHFF
ncbi:MAG: adenosylcobinamide-GDP ribazoletransferase [Candidatus Omnitrophota bacterium]|nr:MAG: adenosylcobinamide-GDP ribazoletransferase [Candidatus Omnitrophota bacterium]